MRRTVLSSITVMSLTAIAITIGACATAPVDDDLSGLTQDQSPAEPQGDDSSAKLPPASQDNNTATDAGSDAKAPPKDASAPKDASTPPVDSGNPPTSSGACDANDPTYLIKFIAASNPTPCPCTTASECCYQSIVCLPK